MQRSNVNMFGKLNVNNSVAEMEEKKACHLVVVLTTVSVVQPLNYYFK
jgi:hypothetical protein